MCFPESLEKSRAPGLGLSFPTTKLSGIPAAGNCTLVQAPVGVGDETCLQPGFNAQFTQYLGHVKLDRAFGYVEAPRDAAIRISLAEQFENFPLSRGEQRDPAQLRFPGGVSDVTPLPPRPVFRCVRTGNDSADQDNSP